MIRLCTSATGVCPCFVGACPWFVCYMSMVCVYVWMICVGSRYVRDLCVSMVCVRMLCPGLCVFIIYFAYTWYMICVCPLFRMFQMVSRVSIAVLCLTPMRTIDGCPPPPPSAFCKLFIVFHFVLLMFWQDLLLYTEDDQLFWMGIGKSDSDRSGLAPWPGSFCFGDLFYDSGTALFGRNV